MSEKCKAEGWLKGWKEQSDARAQGSDLKKYL